MSGALPIIDKWADYREANRDLSRGIDRPAYILAGEEVFLVRQIRGRLTDSLVTPGSEMMDSVTFNGDGKPASLDAEKLAAEIATPPFLSEHKVITLINTGLFTLTKAGEESLSDILTRAFLAIPDRCHLIFMEESAKATSGLMKKMRKAGALAVKLELQTEGELQKWVSGLCHREGLRITREAADSLILRCGRSMSDIFGELATVFLYCAYTGKKEISLSDIDFLCREDLTGKIFDLTDAIAAGRADRALERLGILLARREAPLYIQTMLARQTRDLLAARELGTSDRIMASGLTASSFFAGKLAQQARRFSIRKLESMLESCFQADMAVKTGRLDGEDALAILVIRACQPAG